MSRIITKEAEEVLESFEYLDDILDYLNKLQDENGYTDEEMDNDLEVALWRAYVLNNYDDFKAFALSEKILKKVEAEGINSGLWCYRYSCAIMYMKKFEEALKYSIRGTEVEPDYPWGWLQLARLYYKFKMIDEAYKAIEKGLELVPGDYEFLTLIDDIKNDRGFGIASSHYINPEVDQDESNPKLINLDEENEEVQEEFKTRYTGDKKKSCV